LHMAMFLIEYAKNTAAWANEKTQATLTTAQEQAKAIWHEIQRRAEPISERSEAIVLNMVQTLASTMAALTQQLVKLSSPYLPESVEKPVMASAAYANELRDNFAKAKTLGDLRDEMISEAKQQIGHIQDGLSKGFDYLVEIPPVAWLVPARAQSDTGTGETVLVVETTTIIKETKAENGHVDGQDHHDQENGFY